MKYINTATGTVGKMIDYQKDKGHLKIQNTLVKWIKSLGKIILFSLTTFGNKVME